MSEAADNFTRDVFAWEDQVLADRGMTPLALHIALVIRQHWNRERGDAWPSQKLIASKLAVTDRAVRNAIDQLASRGHLFVVTPNGRKGRNHYHPIVKAVDPVHRNGGSGSEADNRNDGSYETADHRNSGSGKDPVHRNGGSGESGVHRNSGSGLTGTSVPPNHLNEPSEEIDSISTLSPSKPKRTRAKPQTSDADFHELWLQYPRRTGKTEARRSYDRIISTGEATHAELMAGAMRYAAERAAEAERDPSSTRYVKHPSTWLNKGCWPTNRNL